MNETLKLFSFVFVILFSVTLHEYGHAFVAHKFGDDTAKNEGRLSMNPLVHLDPLGSLLLPAILYLMKSPLLFAWAIPVPINPDNFKHKKLGNFFVAFAGPLSNIMIAVVSALLLHINPSAKSLGNEILTLFISLNCILAAFNLLPIPPLDGSKMFSAFLSEKLANLYLKIEDYGRFILLGLIIVPRLFGFPSPILYVLYPVFHSLYSFVLLVSGHG